MTRILVADDQARVRLALSILLEQESRLEISGEATDAATLQESVIRAAPDLVLLDWELPGREQERMLSLQRRDGSLVPVIAMSSQPEVASAALARGAAGFICKGDPPEAVLAAIYAVIEDSQDTGASAG